MAVKRTTFWFQSATAILLWTVGTGMGSAQKGQDQVPPNELVLYVRDAKRRGVEEAKIKQQAIAFGWSAATVDAAIGYEKSGKMPAQAAKPATSSTSAAEPGESPGTTQANRVVLDDYLIGAGDILQIVVFKEPDLSVPIAPVRPDGRITVPLIKEILVGGLTPRGAEQVIADGLRKFVEDANVTVMVTNFNSKKIYVIGAVRKESPIPYTYGMTVLQALSEAGGISEYAKKDKIYIIRSESGREYRMDFNYKEVIKGEKMEQNVLLLPNDTIVIPQ